MSKKPNGKPLEKPSFRHMAKVLGRILGMMFRAYPRKMVLTGLVILLSSLARVLGDVFLGQVVVGYYVPLGLAAAGMTGALATPSLQGPLLALFSHFDFGGAIALMAAIYALGLLCTYLYQRMISQIGQGFQKQWRDRVFRHMETLPLSYFDQRTHGDIMSIYTNDIDTLREFTSRVLPMALQSLTSMVLAMAAMIVTLAWPLIIVVTFFAALSIYLVLVVSRQSGRFFIAQQKALGATDGYIEEMISGQKVIKVFNHEKKAEEDFDRLNGELAAYTEKAQEFSNAVGGPITANIANLQYAVTALVGGLSVLSGVPGVSIGVIVSFLSLGKGFTMPIGQLASQLNMTNSAMAGAERIFALGEEKSESDEGYVTLVDASPSPTGEPLESKTRTGRWAWKHPHQDGTVSYVWLQGKINLYNVDFAYVPGKPVLHGITLYAEPGQKVAFVGPTGAGKTTITNLLNRFYDIADGKIRFDDININKIKKKDLRRAMGIVLQDTNLFTGTVADNIRYGNPDATDEEVVQAAKLANADHFIRALPQGYDTILSGAGQGLSQGQRQLLSIARAACANPPVLILDEATSSIDSRTEALVQKGMDAIMKGRTVFVIAHRLSTIQNADVIMVLQDGRIIERGTHDSLLEQQGKYYQLYTGGKALS